MYQVPTLRIIDTPWSIAAGDASRMSRQPLEENRPMALPRPQRKLAAILAADVAGYSRLMSLDEAGTASRLREQQAAISPVVEEHGGRVVKITGDGMLIELSSAVAAVECAIAMQRLLELRNAQIPADLRLALRIGINVGDVIIAGDDILGEAVNVAARLESMAEPNGICVSRAAYEQSRAKVEAQFVDLGEQRLKNIAEPVHVYAIPPEHGEGHGAPTAQPAAASNGPRLSIAVLPFLDLGDRPHGALADGLTECLTTDLARIPGAAVTARNSASAYRDKAIDVARIGRELGVRYLLEGSIQHGSDRLRVNAQLIDALSGVHLWAERFDKDRKDLLELEDEIVARLTRGIAGEMLRNEAAHLSSSGSGGFNAADLAMRGQAAATDIRRKEKAAEAAELFQEALALDPDNVEALAGLVTTRSFQVLNLYEASRREPLLLEAETLIRRALALAPDHVGALRARAILLRARGRFAQAVAAIRSVMALSPGEPTAYRELGLSKLYLGETREAADCFRRADSIAPRDVERWSWLQGLGRALLQLGEDEQAIETLWLALQSNPNHQRGKALLAAAQALAGDTAGARLQIAEFMETDPAITVRTFAQERSPVPPETVSQAYLAENHRIHEGLRCAGMPV